MNYYLPFAQHIHLFTCLLIYLLTYLLTPFIRVLLEKLKGSQLVKKFPTFLEPESSSSFLIMSAIKSHTNTIHTHITLPDDPS